MTAMTHVAYTLDAVDAACTSIVLTFHITRARPGRWIVWYRIPGRTLMCGPCAIVCRRKLRRVLRRGL